MAGRPILETDRLLLREFDEADVEPLGAFLRDVVADLVFGDGEEPAAEGVGGLLLAEGLQVGGDGGL